MWVLLLVRKPAAAALRRAALSCVLAALACGLSAGSLRAHDPAVVGLAEPLTDPADLWQLTTERKNSPVPIRFEGRVSYYDPGFHLLWLETQGVGTYILLGSHPPPLRAGQRVRIEGTLIANRGLSGADVTVTVLQEFQPITPLETQGRIGDVASLASRVVTAEAYVDAQQDVDAEHIRLLLIVEDRPVIGWVRPINYPSVPHWVGKFIRIQALYSSRFDPTNTGSTIELWTDERDLQVVGSLADHDRFRRERTPIDRIYLLPSGSRVLVRGRVEAHHAGTSITVRDETGEIVVRSCQRERLPFGAPVEAEGEVTIDGARWVLRSGLYRQARSGPDPQAFGEPGMLERVERVRELSPAEAEQGRPVRISGMVTWSMPGSDFFFLEDVSGGIRVRFDPKRIDTPSLLKYLEIEGVTANGGVVPVIVAQRIRDRGSMSAPDPRPITYDRAMTGREDGQWVEMRGFLQRTISDGDWRWIYITTPGGEFVAHLQSPVTFVANSGSLIRVQGVCETATDRLGQVTGVMLRVPFIHDFTVEEDAPLNPFDLPQHPIKGLRQLGGVRDMTRVRVVGTVLHAVPGRLVYLQQDDSGVTVLTRQTDALRPGDRVDAVGVLGWEGPRVVIREAVLRTLGSDAPPAPHFIAEPSRLAPLADARLVTVRGRLIDVSRQHDHTRFTLQAGGALFGADLDHPEAEAVDPPIGAGLELTGVYLLSFDTTRQTRGFMLQLRSPADIRVQESPRLLSIQRALIACAVLGAFVLLGIAWITALRRRVRRQTEQIRAQLERQSELEAEVQRAARLESLGALAGGIAHDFNNLLTIIIGNLGLAMLDPKLTETTGHCLREIERGTSRARALTRQLLTFAKGGEPVRAPVALADVVQTAADRALQGTPRRCRYQFAPDLWLADADKDQVAQVIHNLVLNAEQATCHRGEISIAMENAEIPADARPPLTPGRYVRIAVTDTGEGIAAEHLPKVFDPYFTTRTKGSGLGLATVYSIVKRHAGHVEVRSKPGEGSTFTVWLPVAERPAPAAEVAKATAPLQEIVTPPKPKRVLLMDDEPSIQKVVSQVLSRRGLVTIAVSDGAAAMEAFTEAFETGNRFDLLVLDLTVPGGMGGREVMERVRRLDAAVPAIVSSGYSSDPVMANFAQYGFQAMVQKPYEITELVVVVERLLGSGKTGPG